MMAIDHYVIFLLMVKLIADSGSTKTAWCLVDEQGDQHMYKTVGLNPFFLNPVGISEIIQKELIDPSGLSGISNDVQVFFYGAGCSTEKNCSIVKEGIGMVLTGAEVYVEHDLLGAARALCGTTPGIAAILGTGSNSCYYDGKVIVDNVPALGFILGDEGSGAHMGKRLVRDYLYREMPVDLADKFKRSYQLNKEDILPAVYQQPTPNSFLASFSVFLSENITETYCRNVVKKSFIDFFDHHVLKYDKQGNLPLNIVGSIAVAFEAELREIAEEKGVEIGKLIKQPIDELVRYHLSN